MESSPTGSPCSDDAASTSAKRVRSASRPGSASDEGSAHPTDLSAAGASANDTASCTINSIIEETIKAARSEVGKSFSLDTKENGSASPGFSQLAAPWDATVKSNIAPAQQPSGSSSRSRSRASATAAAANGSNAARPKRGQYRKYDKSALDEAVKAVRRGEMSVHRAGSYFGVPHSTLEYKVKERNLLRSKKKAAAAAELANAVAAANAVDGVKPPDTTTGVPEEPAQQPEGMSQLHQSDHEPQTNSETAGCNQVQPLSAHSAASDSMHNSADETRLPTAQQSPFWQNWATLSASLIQSNQKTDKNECDGGSAGNGGTGNQAIAVPLAGVEG